MSYFWGFIGWLMGSFLPTLEASWLAYKQGQSNQRLKQAQEEINAALQADAKVKRAIEIKQALDSAGAAGADRMRAWYAALKRGS